MEQSVQPCGFFSFLLLYWLSMINLNLIIRSNQSFFMGSWDGLCCFTADYFGYRLSRSTHKFVLDTDLSAASRWEWASLQSIHISCTNYVTFFTSFCSKALEIYTHTHYLSKSVTVKCFLWIIMLLTQFQHH